MPTSTPSSFTVSVAFEPAAPGDSSRVREAAVVAARALVDVEDGVDLPITSSHSVLTSRMPASAGVPAGMKSRS